MAKRLEDMLSIGTNVYPLRQYGMVLWKPLVGIHIIFTHFNKI